MKSHRKWITIGVAGLVVLIALVIIDACISPFPNLVSEVIGASVLGPLVALGLNWFLDRREKLLWSDTEELLLHRFSRWLKQFFLVQGGAIEPSLWPQMSIKDYKDHAAKVITAFSSHVWNRVESDQFTRDFHEQHGDTIRKLSASVLSEINKIQALTERYLQLPKRDPKLVELLQALEDITVSSPEERQITKATLDLHIWPSLDVPETEESRKRALELETLEATLFLYNIFFQARKLLDYMIDNNLWRPTQVQKA
jgi:hypothetical protein